MTAESARHSSIQGPVRSGPRARVERDGPAGFTDVVRFDRVERWLHWTNAVLVLTLVGTGSVMYLGSLSGLVGHRVLVDRVHLYSGLILPLPFVATVAGRWGDPFRRDARRLGRFMAEDWRWFNGRLRRAGAVTVGKFNAGQKLNAVLVAGTLPVMLVTGAIMHWHGPFSDSIRTGATFVHDWGYVGLSLLILGHIVRAAIDPPALGAMWSGTAPRDWIADEHPGWLAELDRASEPATGTEGPSGGRL